MYVVFIFVGGSLVFGETAKYSFNAFIFFLFRFMFYFSLPFKDLFKKTNNIIKQVAFKSAIDYKGALCHTQDSSLVSVLGLYFPFYNQLEQSFHSLGLWASPQTKLGKRRPLTPRL